MEGWCWDEDNPTDRVSVTILVDGIEAGSALAALYREDLLRAEIGDGHHGFSVTLRDINALMKQTLILTMMRGATGEEFGEPLVCTFEDNRSFAQRIQELEANNRLLTSRLEELAPAAAAEASQSELFAMIGAFFLNLAQNPRKSELLAVEQRLDEAVRTVSKTLPTISLSTPVHATMTVLVEACCSLHQLHACLASLERAGVGRFGHVVVLDPGVSDEVCLITTAVRGIRYVRTATDLTLEWIEVEQSSRTELLVLLSGRALVGEDYLQEVVDSFAGNAVAAACGAEALDADGTVRHGGLRLRDGQLQDSAALAERSGQGLPTAYAAHALSHHAVAFRSRALRAVGTFDPAFGDDLAASVIDLCFRLWQNGWSVVVQPYATLTLQPGQHARPWSPAPGAAATPSGELLRSRWLEQDGDRVPLQAGCAVIVGDDVEFSEGLSVAHELREAVYAVTYLSSQPVPRAWAAKLSRAGAVMTDKDFDASTQAADLVYYSDGHTAPGASGGDERVVVGRAALASFLARQREQGLSPR